MMIIKVNLLPISIKMNIEYSIQRMEVVATLGTAYWKVNIRILKSVEVIERPPTQHDVALKHRTNRSGYLP